MFLLGLISPLPGGKEACRSEAFVIGEPLCELSSAMPLAGKSELAIAASAIGLCSDITLRFEGVREEEGGRKCVSLPEACHASTRRQSESLAASSAKPDSAAANSVVHLRSSASHVSRMALVLVKLEAGEDVVAGKRQQQQGLQFHWLWGNWWSSMTRRGGSKSETALVPLAKSTFQTSVQQASLSGLGLDSLLRFVPHFVRERCVSRMSFEYLCEHRKVCVMFVVAKPEVMMVFSL